MKISIKNKFNKNLNAELENIFEDAVLKYDPNALLITDYDCYPVIELSDPKAMNNIIKFIRNHQFVRNNQLKL